MTPLPPDPYKILGVSKDAQIPEIRSAHRKLVLKCHPDKVQDPKLKAEKQDEFQKVQQAYELLSDDNERQRYDDQVKLAELRKQFQNKANISTPRSSPKEYNVYTAEPPRVTTNPGRSPPSPVSKTYPPYARSWEDEPGRGPRIFDAGPSRSSRRESNYVERPPKREVEREREKERDSRDRGKERDVRDRRRRDEDAARRAEKAEKDARRAEKKQRDKQKDKEIRREADEKKRYPNPYIEAFDDESPALKSDRRKSTSKKYDEKRDRSSGREDGPAAMPPPPPRAQRSFTNLDYAHSYIEASRAKNGGLQRAATYHTRNVQPPAPTPPPPVVGQSSPFALPDEDVRRSSAHPRRGSGDGPRLSRERSYRASSREPLDDPIVVSASPTSRLTAQFLKSAGTSPVAPSSPPRRELPRTNTMPVDAAFSRAVPGIARAQTFNSFGEAAPRGRDRSRMYAQIEEESDSDDAYDRRPRDRKHRSSRRHRSPEAARTENVSRYQVDGGRAKLQSGYSRHLEPEVEQVRYYSAGNIPVKETRPSMPVRESSYTTSAMNFPKVKTSKVFSPADVQYSNYFDKSYREYPVYP